MPSPMAEAIQVRLARLEQHGAMPPLASVQWPDVREAAALYLAIALIRGRDEIPGPGDILARLADLGWLRAARLRTDRSHGIGWLAPRSVGVAQYHVSQFVETVFGSQYNGTGNGHD